MPSLALMLAQLTRGPLHRHHPRMAPVCSRLGHSILVYSFVASFLSVQPTLELLVLICAQDLPVLQSLTRET